ncbi:uncharacterized protein KGF55_005033 [Candida pseudojiufengensis]|uniref:uncharacterized protein n=1 Tax=Candida pseudojiufengensis TaxID=497109 RepID=UPI00222416FB|nr:uncharacterized protein KGF55_005033 [Candida pseudojiufengensis]KAI5959801.1 hypothetical protein KGF55_005033 [Candida pseudojiufengensis]
MTSSKDKDSPPPHNSIKQSKLSINTNINSNDAASTSNNQYKPNHKAKSSSISISTNPNQSLPYQSNQHNKCNMNLGDSSTSSTSSTSSSSSNTVVPTPIKSSINSPISSTHTPINSIFTSNLKEQRQPPQEEIDQEQQDYDDNESIISSHLKSQNHNNLYKLTIIKSTLYIIGWYFFSLSISLYNKWMFGSVGLNFKFPILITSFHQFCLFLLSFAILFLKPGLRPKQINYKGNHMGKFLINMFGGSDFKSVVFKNILPCSITSAGDIGLSNFAISLISLSLYTMLKTSSLIFVLIFGLIFKLEKFNWRLIIIVFIMCCSVIMMVNKPEDIEDDDSVEDIESKNSKFGIILVIFASMLSGLRWSFTQILLKKNPYTSNSISTIFYISPLMSLILFILGLVIEGWYPFINSNIWEKFGIFKTIVLLIIPGILAFFMTLCEFKLLKIAQIITLSIAGIFKELLTIVLSFLIFNDKLNFINILGLVITFSDILWYNYYRFIQNENENHHHNFQNLDNQLFEKNDQDIENNNEFNDGIEYVKLKDLEINEFNRT